MPYNSFVTNLFFMPPAAMQPSSSSSHMNPFILPVQPMNGLLSSSQQQFTNPNGRQHQNEVKNNSQMSTSAQPSQITCQICFKNGHTTLRSWNRFNFAHQPTEMPQALAALQLSETGLSDWIPDSGASAHMTRDEGNFLDKTPYLGTDSVMIGDVKLLYITGIGTVKVDTSDGPITQQNVLYVPALQKKLLSISQFTKERDSVFEFTSTGFLIRNPRTRRVIATGSRQGSQYALE